MTCLALADELHDLVLTFAGHLLAREDDLAASPCRIGGELVAHKVLDVFGETCHERSARCDAVAVERILRYRYTFGACLLECFVAFACRSKTTRTLLVHLGTRCDTIDSHKEDLARFHKAEDLFQVTKNVLDHFAFTQEFGSALGVVIWMRTAMDDAVHVQIEMIELWMQVSFHGGVDERVALRHPSKELGHSHSESKERRGIRSSWFRSRL
mmetsp:Transcript_34898/g.87809  ORF Transcript_34898/g.87809 Transcript_34898/m.87809 type:complete len:212 (-) Transcript_34898:23-658(-)